jgi:hypothetical protein
MVIGAFMAAVTGSEGGGGGRPLWLNGAEDGGGGVHGAATREEVEVALDRRGEEEEGRVGCVG